MTVATQGARAAVSCIPPQVGGGDGGLTASTPARSVGQVGNVSSESFHSQTLVFRRIMRQRVRAKLFANAVIFSTDLCCF
jgi:hypothetical protein